MEAVKIWHQAMKSKDASIWNELLDDDVVFHSPVSFYASKRQKNYNDVPNGGNGRFWERQTKLVYLRAHKLDQNFTISTKSWEKPRPYWNLNQK